MAIEGEPRSAALPTDVSATRGAVVVNPTKCRDLARFHRVVDDEFKRAGLERPLFMATSAEDAGGTLANRALASGANLLIACGGDGTVTACVGSLAGTAVPLGVVPLGTGNLFARNLRLPHRVAAALRVAVAGREQQLDVAWLNGQPFVVMAGVGFDALMLTDASDRLKARLGWPAYVVAALRHLGDPPIRARLRLDDQPAFDRPVKGIIIGNLGRLRAGIPLLPDADPTDGFLDVALIAPHGSLGWLRVAWAVLATHRRVADLERVRARAVRIELAEPMTCERDGDIIDFCTELDVRLTPGALRVRMPPLRG